MVETHVMTHQFQMAVTNTQGEDEEDRGVLKLVVPRLKRNETHSFKHFNGIKLEHYTGSGKVNPPTIELKSRIPYARVQMGWYLVLCTVNYLVKILVLLMFSLVLLI